MRKHLHCQSTAKKLENSEISVHLIQSLIYRIHLFVIWEKNAISSFSSYLIALYGGNGLPDT